MMMAFDSSRNPPSRLDEQVVASVREALRAYLADPQVSDGLGSALGALAGDARRRQLLPEQMLVVLKDVWSTLPEVRAMTNQGEQTRMLQRVVTMCIKEYYDA